MTWFIFLLTIIVITYLFFEQKNNLKNRKKLLHVIHVNGIRGKSSTARLIHAGLIEGGYKSFCKTTGTVPMMINSKNEEIPIKRKGRANIKEQIEIMNCAVEDGANVLVIECMAVDPNLQYISQRNILKADIGVITNIRLDHTEEMGINRFEIAESISNMIPEDGILITSERKYFDILEERAKKNNTEIIKVVGKDSYDEINFRDNVACAVKVCEKLGVDEKTALAGMKNFIRDPYDLRIYKFPSGAIFVNGLSINDPDSSEMVYRDLEEKYDWKEKNLILLINNRPDRGYRANHMIKLSKILNPKKVLLSGSFSRRLKAELKKYDPTIIKDLDDLDFNEFSSEDIIYAVGNIANSGDEILKKAMREGIKYV